MNGLASLAEQLDAVLPGAVTRDASSAPLTTYRCGGSLALLVKIGSEDALRRLAEVLGAHDAPVLVVGRGSNLLVADAGFPGVGIVLHDDFEQLNVDRLALSVHAGGAVPLPVLARRVGAAGISGLEFFVGIPGTVGGAVFMNAGGHGHETKDVLAGARICALDSGEVRELGPGDLGLGYRHSGLTKRDVVIAATFAGEEGDPAESAERIDEIVRWRREHQPGGQNAGSVFTNPPGDAAGRLIEACGLKGLRVGGVVVSEKHANFFVAEDGATAGDVVALIEEVQRRVHAETGVQLSPELHMVGFDNEESA